MNDAAEWLVVYFQFKPCKFKVLHGSKSQVVTNFQSAENLKIIDEVYR